MSTNTRRSAHRVACRFPVVVEGRSKPMVLQAEDVSRNGMKLRVPRNQLQLPSLPTLGQVAGKPIVACVTGSRAAAWRGEDAGRNALDPSGGTL